MKVNVYMNEHDLLGMLREHLGLKSTEAIESVMIEMAHHNLETPGQRIITESVLRWAPGEQLTLECKTLKKAEKHE